MNEKVTDLIKQSIEAIKELQAVTPSKREAAIVLRYFEDAELWITKVSDPAPQAE